jgi:hypothetical protein
MTRAVTRLVLMMLVMGGVLVTATAVGLPAAAVLGLSLTLAGLAGMLGLSRRQVSGPGHPATVGGSTSIDGPSVTIGSGTTDHGSPEPADPLVASMAPQAAIDPEANMPRWRRPSLLAARKADPMRMGRIARPPLRFPVSVEPDPSRRVVRYAVVALLDRPDEVLGRQLSDLLAGDEIEVLDSGGPYWEVLCPDGMRGWVHRTTLGMPGVAHQTFGRLPDPVAEPDDLLTAVLSARGIQ